MHAFMRTASDRLRMRQGRPGSFVRGILVAAAVFGVSIAVVLSGVGGSYALLNRTAMVNAGTIASGTITAGETVKPSLTFTYKNGQTTTTGGVLVANTGNVPASYSTTVTLGSGSSSPLATAVTVIAWQVADLSTCTTTATIPSGAYTGSWASIVSGTASPLTGTLAAGGSFGYCLRTTMNVNAAPGITSGSAVTPVFTTTLTIGGWISTTTASATQTLIDDIAPSVPTDIASTSVSATSTQLSWTASTDNVGVVAYAVYRNGVLISPAAGVSGTTFLDSKVGATAYPYAVTARDAAGNVSSSGYVPAPPTVTVTAATPTTTTVNWTAATDGNGGTTKYDVYRTDVLTGQSIKVVAATTLRTFTDTVKALGTYTYLVVARDTAGNTATSAPAGITMTKVDSSVWYQIVLAASSQPLCVDLNGASTAQGTSLIQWTCKAADDTGRSNQEWQFVAQATTGRYSVISHLLPSATPAYEWYASKPNGGRNTAGVVDMVSDTGSTAMQWTLTRLANGNFTVTNVGLSQCLTAITPLNATNSTPLSTTTCDASRTTQQFTLEQVSTP